MNWLQPLTFTERPKEKPRSYVRRMQRYKRKVRKGPIRLKRNGLPDTSRKVIVDGKEFPTISAASKYLGVSTTRLYAMDDEGLVQIL